MGSIVAPFGTTLQDPKLMNPKKGIGMEPMSANPKP